MNERGDGWVGASDSVGSVFLSVWHFPLVRCALASCDAAATVTCLRCLFLRVRGHESSILLYSLDPHLKSRFNKISLFTPDPIKFH